MFCSRFNISRFIQGLFSDAKAVGSLKNIALFFLKNYEWVGMISRQETAGDEWWSYELAYR